MLTAVLSVGSLPKIINLSRKCDEIEAPVGAHCMSPKIAQKSGNEANAGACNAPLQEIRENRFA